MSETLVAKRYADALFQLGNEKGTLDEWVASFSTVKEVFLHTEQLDMFLTHPSVSYENKRQILDEAFGSMPTDVLNTLKLLVERGRANVIPAMADHFIQLAYEQEGIAEAYVHSVRELSDKERKQLEITFAKRFNKKKIHIINQVDPDILGGIKVQVGNTVFDGTVKNKLKRIERDIITANN